jgi:signal transduction histidine kinase
VAEGPAVTLQADSDQLDQLLINLLKNAAEATEESGGTIEISWAVSGDRLEVEVRDEGPGLPPTSNLFVPFFTTKPNGSGIGLVFCRQVAEAHGGEVSVSNRADRRGTVARVRLPFAHAG